MKQTILPPHLQILMDNPQKRKFLQNYINKKHREEKITDIPFPKNPYRKEGITNKEFRQEIKEIREEKKKKYGTYFRI